MKLKITILLFILLLSTEKVFANPSFTLQTGQSCSSCHTIAPQLTSFGRQFKLNGYSLTGIEGVSAYSKTDSTSKYLDLLPFSTLSIGTRSAATVINKEIPGTQASGTQLFQQLNVFFAGKVAPNLGAYIELTYDPESGTIGLDNSELRYANHTELFSNDLLYGIFLNNNPTHQDAWNTLPAWGFPFTTSSTAYTPNTNTLFDKEAVGGQVVGLGLYSLYNNLLYTEIAGYRPSPQGAVQIHDSTSTNLIRGVAPYYRVALQHKFGDDYIMVGTFGFFTNLRPIGLTGAYDEYRTLGFDAQYERPVGSGSLTARIAYITEKQTLNATHAEGGSTNLSNTINSFKVNASYYFAERFGFTLGYFSINGDTDPLYYSDMSVKGSANSNGFIGQFDYKLWLNVILSLQYTAYTKFNGASSNYDGNGRNASDNNCLYLVAWLLW